MEEPAAWSTVRRQQKSSQARKEPAAGVSSRRDTVGPNRGTYVQHVGQAMSTTRSQSVEPAASREFHHSAEKEKLRTDEVECQRGCSVLVSAVGPSSRSEPSSEQRQLRPRMGILQAQQSFPPLPESLSQSPPVVRPAWTSIVQSGPAREQPLLTSIQGTSSSAQSAPDQAWVADPADVSKVAQAIKKAVNRERLALEARRSRMDAHGKVRCLSCLKTLTTYSALEQHLLDKHAGENSEERRLWEAKEEACSVSKPKQSKRPQLSLGDLLVAPKTQQVPVPPTGVAKRKGRSITLGLAAFYKEAVPRGAPQPTPPLVVGRKRGGRITLNPNTASSTALVVRRGKERLQPKKKRVTRLKRIILRERAERKARELGGVESDRPGGNSESEWVEDTGSDQGEEVSCGGAMTRSRETSSGTLSSNSRPEGVLVEALPSVGPPKASVNVEVDAEASEKHIRGCSESGDSSSAQSSACKVIQQPQQSTSPSTTTTTGRQPLPKAPGEASTSAVITSAQASSSSLRGKTWSDVAAAHPASSSPAATPGGASTGVATQGEGAVLGLEKLKKSRGRRKQAGGREPQTGTGGSLPVSPPTLELGAGEVEASQEGQGGGKKARRRRKRKQDGGEEAVDITGGVQGEQGRDKGQKSGKQTPNTYIGPIVNIRYCKQVITPELNSTVVELLSELLRFQERALEKDPIKAQAKRRYVIGLRETYRAVRLKRAKAVVVAPNIEEITSEGGLDCTLSNILEAAEQNEIPVVFALTKNRIAQVFNRRVRMSMVGILSFDGANAQYKQMLALADKGRDEWRALHVGDKAFRDEEKSVQLVDV